MLYVVTHLDEAIFREFPLAYALDRLADIQDPDCGEDACIWYGDRVVCVRRPSGQVVWIDPTHKPAAAAAA